MQELQGPLLETLRCLMGLIFYTEYARMQAWQMACHRGHPAQRVQRAYSPV